MKQKSIFKRVQKIIALGLLVVLLCSMTGCDSASSELLTPKSKIKSDVDWSAITVPEKMQVTTYDASLPDGLTVESVTQMFFPGEETVRRDYKAGLNIDSTQSGWSLAILDDSYNESLWVNNQWIGTPQDCNRMSWWDSQATQRPKARWAYDCMREAQNSALYGPIYAQLTKPTTNTARMAEFVAEAEKILTETNYTGYRLSTAQQFTPDVLQKFLDATSVNPKNSSGDALYYSGGDLYWIEFEVYEPETPEAVSKVNFVFTDEGLLRVEFSGLHKNYQVVSEVRICSPQKAFENVSEIMLGWSNADEYTLAHVELISALDGETYRPRWVFTIRRNDVWMGPINGVDVEIPIYRFSCIYADAETGEPIVINEFRGVKHYQTGESLTPITEYNSVEK